LCGRPSRGVDACRHPPAGCTKFTPLRWEHCIGSIQQPHESLAPPTRLCFELHKRDFDADAGYAPKTLTQNPPSHNTPATHTHTHATCCVVQDGGSRGVGTLCRHWLEPCDGRVARTAREQHVTDCIRAADNSVRLFPWLARNCVSSHSVCPSL
jgi:hypothetical protein